MIPMHLISHEKCLLVFGNLSASLHSARDWQNWQIKMPHLFNADARLIMNSWKRAINMKSQIYLNICCGHRALSAGLAVGLSDIFFSFLAEVEAPRDRESSWPNVQVGKSFLSPRSNLSCTNVPTLPGIAKIRKDGRKIYNMASFAARRALACCTIVG